MIRRCIIVILFVYPFVGYTQNFPKATIDVQKLTDELLAQQDLDLNYEELYENLLQILSNPLPLNSATEEDFRFLTILSEQQLQSLLEYRKNQNGFSSVYELQSVDYFDLPTIKKFAPFVTFSETKANKNFFQEIKATKNSYLILRYDYTFQKKRGFTSEADSAHKFLGTEGRIYSRFRSSKPGKYSIGFTLEKDAGEMISWRPQQKYYGVDYSSFHVQLQNKGIVKNLIIGDFQGQFGQGLTLGGFFGFGKGSETITSIRRSNLGFIPYTSVHESGMLRGIATTLKVSRSMTFSMFYSRKGKDAILANALDNETITSFQTTGLHRNEKELSTRNRINETNFGSILDASSRKLKGGFIFHGTRFEHPVNKSSSVYNQFAFSGIQNLNISAYGSYTFQNFNFFSEVTKTVNGGWAGLAGILGSLTNHLDVSLLFRKYDPNFHSFYSNAFGESSIPQNESGMYWGWKYAWNKKIALAGYFDLFAYKWLRYRSYSPSTGREWLLRFNYAVTKNSLLYLQYREEQKSRNTSVDGNLYLTATGTKRTALLNFTYELSKSIRMKTRLQGSSYQFNNETTTGIALLQDLQWKINRFEFTGRYALFQTDDYENRQYTYENDTYLAYTFPSYYGKGLRTYLMIAYQFNDHITLWIRYAHSRYLDQDSIGSGMDSIQGDQRDDLRIQFVLRP